MRDTVKVAFVGAGAMTEQHCRVMGQMPMVELAGIASRTRAKAEQTAARHGIAVVADNVVDLFARTNADLVMVSVKELVLHEILRDAVRFPWVVFMEKPMGHRMDIAMSIRDMFAAAGKRGYVGLNRRYFDSTLRAQRILAEVAGPRHILVQDQQSIAAARQIGHPDDVAEHFMYANSIHTIDYIRNFGRGKVSAVVRDGEWQGADTFMQAASIRFSSGDTARYEAVWQGPGPWGCSINTKEVRLELRPLERLTVQRVGERTVTAVDIDPIDTDFKAGFHRQAKAVLDAVRGEPSDLPDVEEALRTMQLVHSIYGK
ncbi:MAG: Gfo/Idh/MocA family oxidoreductase [Rhizobiaceae bacterium]|nr:Gfo/Idh/MocA family oxidoreductase [Rhizobiaceae bacterium]